MRFDAGESQDKMKPRLAVPPLAGEGDSETLAVAKSVIRMEAEALEGLSRSLGAEFSAAVGLLMAAPGKVVLTGVGKSGLIARKIASTMNSTGTMATFLHPSDAVHGDLGVLAENDVVIAIGKSGESDELVAILPSLRRLGAKIIAITANAGSTLAQQSDIVLVTPLEREACPLDLAPTVSTTLALALGDALAMTLMRLKNFRPEDFAKYHPGGRLGKRLLLRVADLMIRRENCPVLDPRRATIEDVIGALGKYGLGIVLFSEDGRSLAGILTDGDLRRLLSKHKADVFGIVISDVMIREPITIGSEWKAVEALRLMEERKTSLNVLPIVDDGVLVGVARLHELLKVS